MKASLKVWTWAGYNQVAHKDESQRPFSPSPVSQAGTSLSPSSQETSRKEARVRVRTSKTFA